MILAVTLLVIIILGAGLWLLRNKPSEPVAKAAEPAENNYFEIPFSNAPLPGLVSPSPSPQSSPAPGTEKQEFVYGPGPSENASSAPTEKKSAPAAQSSPSPRIRQEPTSPGRLTSTKSQAGPVRASIQYWIQTGSYKSKSKADSCNAALVDNGLSGIVIPRTVHGETFFRVRIGPYASKAEAEKFLAWIKKIPGFDESYISIDLAVKN